MMTKLYRQTELTDEDSDIYVFPHVMAMTGEKLHSKSEIAEELGVRDKRITELEAVLDLIFDSNNMTELELSILKAIDIRNKDIT